MEQTDKLLLSTRRYEPDRFAQGLLTRVAWGIGVDLYLMDGYGLGHHSWDVVQDDLRNLLDPHVDEISGRIAHRISARLEDLMAVWHHDETWRQGQELSYLFRTVQEHAMVNVEEALRLVATRTDVA